MGPSITCQFFLLLKTRLPCLRFDDPRFGRLDTVITLEELKVNSKNGVEPHDQRTPPFVQQLWDSLPSWPLPFFCLCALPSTCDLRFSTLPILRAQVLHSYSRLDSAPWLGSPWRSDASGKLLRINSHLTGFGKNTFLPRGSGSLLHASQNERLMRKTDMFEQRKELQAHKLEIFSSLYGCGNFQCLPASGLELEFEIAKH